MPFSSYKRLRFIFLIYWTLLIYIIAALVWWFIALNQQNRQMAAFEKAQLDPANGSYGSQLRKIEEAQKRKTAQYVGEGAIFLLVILSGAVFIFRAVRRQFKWGQQQQNFMMAITHELKTPIAVTKLNLETLQKRALDESQRNRLLQNTIQEANRLNALCNNMLLASQIESGGHRLTREEINFSALVHECVIDFKLRFPSRQFREQIQADVFMNGDLLMLQIAVNNLLDNATKYSPKESPITVALAEATDVVRLSVVDEGKGIGRADKRRVFEKFYRIGNAATRGAKGTGLGLFLTKKIAAEHRARIFVTDNPPTGSNFTIEFRK